MTGEDGVLREQLNAFTHITRKPENFLSKQQECMSKVKSLVKNLYDFTKATEDNTSSDALPELIVQGFDEEQIWQELELQNQSTHDVFITNIARILAYKSKLQFPIKFEGDSDSEHFSEDEEKEENKEDSAEESERTLVEGDRSCEDSRHIVDNVTQNSGKRRTKMSVVDDKFFRLREMEKFLDKEESSTRVKRNDEDDDDDASDESVDYFTNMSLGESEDESGDDDDAKPKSGKTAQYDDFFDMPDEEMPLGADELEEDEGFDTEKEERVATRAVRFMDQSENESEIDEGMDESPEQTIKSAFEVRQERLQKKITEMEETALAEKPWQLTGEVQAAARPSNSLLEEVLQFDQVTRPAPVITEQTSLRLEDIILRRIKDKVWDDVERKIKPVETPFEYKKRLVLDHEKSKLSLAEVYEQEYLKKQKELDSNQDNEEEVPKEHEEITKMMTALFAKLDALSNFHYTPKPAAPEIKVIKNVPAIVMEDVAPVATSDAALLAPEEVKAKPKGEEVAKSERTKTDKKRELRQKKQRQRMKHRERERREKLVNKLSPGLGNKYSKLNALKQLEKDGKITKLEEKRERVKSSQAFFTQLQDEVTNYVENRTSGIQNKSKEARSVKKFKL